jgi:hypothetical protein
MRYSEAKHARTFVLRLEVWQVMEVVIQELTGTGGKRLLNKELGFKLLEP